MSADSTCFAEKVVPVLSGMLIEINDCGVVFRIDGIYRQGGYGVIFYATPIRNESGKEWIFKAMNPDNCSLEMAEHEWEMNQTFAHPNTAVAQYFASIRIEGLPEFCGYFMKKYECDLLDKHSRIDYDDLRRAIHGACCGLSYIHGLGFSHNDVKPENIFIDDDGRGYLADFGTVTELDDFGKTTAKHATIQYWAPEHAAAHVDGIEHGDFDEKGDIWALGISLILMFRTEDPYYPFQGNRDEISWDILNTDTEDLVADLGLPEEAEDFILQCLQHDPEERPSAEDLLVHPFLDPFPQMKPNPLPLP